MQNVDSGSNSNPASYILLGASNLSLGWPAITRLFAQESASIKLYGASGHGRSFGMNSRLFGRELVGILHCGLWKELEDQKLRASGALITDIGNDLVYGVKAEQLLEWVEKVLDRIENHTDKIKVTSLPMGSLNKLGPARFAVVKRLLFPGHPLTFDELQKQVEILESGLEKIHQQRELTTLNPQACWYGLDPIHIKSSYRIEAWQNYLGDYLAAGKGEKESQTKRVKKIDLASRIGFKFIKPQIWKSWGRDCERSQPCWRHNDLSLSLY